MTKIEDGVQIIGSTERQIKTIGTIPTLNSGSAFALSHIGKIKDPILVSSMSNVGTKIRLARSLNRQETLGRDLVAIATNRILCFGALPLTFQLTLTLPEANSEIADATVKGVIDGCQSASCSFTSLELREAPEVVNKLDLSGTMIGAVARTQLIDGTDIEAGDYLVGIPASGPHTSGFNKINQLFDTGLIHAQEEFEGGSIFDALCSPTVIYAQTLRPVFETHADVINGVVHIEDNGLYSISKALPKGLDFHLEQLWDLPPIFEKLKDVSNSTHLEMQQTFNCGIGMVLIVKRSKANLISDFVGGKLIGTITKK